MDEYINRETLLNKIGNPPEWSGYSEPYTFEEHQMLVMAIKKFKHTVKSLPTANVQKVKQGHWEDVQENELPCPDVKITITITTQTCSCCKARIGFIGPKSYLLDSFCPNCSAKMDLQKESKNNG